MNSTDFSSWLTSQELPLEAWGRFVVSEVCKRVEREIGPDRYKGFFKIPPGSRVKETKSAVKKLNKKNYDDPQFQMSDLVGARFVVLLRTDIPIVEAAIQTNNAWTIRRDRNPLDERLEAPTSFDYQSVHYIVRNTTEFTFENVVIPVQTACEVQIRTVLQHAYAELGHDRIYKEEGAIPKTVHRLIARCMALMETTDEIFCSAVEELDRVNLSRETCANLLDAKFKQIGIDFLPTLEDEEAIQILDTFKELIETVDVATVIASIQPNRIEKIKERAKAVESEDDSKLSMNGELFRKPLVLLLYGLVEKYTANIISHWPNPKLKSGLDNVLSDVGRSE